MRRLIYIGVCLWFMYGGIAVAGEDHVLFHLERNRDKHQVFYEIRLDKNGHIDQENPIRSYWIRSDKPDEQIPLTSLQEKYGYGAKIISSNSKEVRFYLAAYPEGIFTAKLKGDKYVSTVCSKGEDVVMSKLYIHFKGDSFWHPVVLQIDVYGLDAQKKEYLLKKVKP